MKTAIIIDNALPVEHLGKKVYWRTWEAPDGISALALQVEQQKQTQKEFLQWVHKFGEAELNGKSICEHLRLPDGFSAWWLSKIFERHPAVYGSGLYEIFKLRAFEQWADQNGIQELVLYTDNPELLLTLSDWCKRTGREFTLKSSLKNSLNHKPNGSSLKNLLFFRFLLALKQVFGWWWHERRHFARTPSAQLKKGVAIAAWFPNLDESAREQGLFVSKYWMALHSVLNKLQLPVQWILIPIGDRAKYSDYNKIKTEFAQNSSHTFTFWQECFSYSDIPTLLKNWLFVAVRGRKLTAHIGKVCNWPNSKLNISSYIIPLWEDSVCGNYHSISMLLYICFKKMPELIGPQELLISPSELQLWERILFGSARQQGTKTICAAMHSMVGSGDFRFFLEDKAWKIPEVRQQMPDYFLCNGSAAHDFMCKGGFPHEYLKNVEALRYPYLDETPLAPSKLPIKRLMVATTYYAPEVETQIRILSEAMELGLADNIADIFIKPHPAHPVEPYLQKYFKKQTAPRVDTSPLPELLQQDTMVYAGNSTTVAVEAVYKGMSLTIQDAIDDFCLSPMGTVSGVYFIRTAKDLIQAAQSPPFVDMPEDFFFLDKNLPKWKKILSCM